MQPPPILIRDEESKARHGREEGDEHSAPYATILLPLF